MNDIQHERGTLTSSSHLHEFRQLPTLGPHGSTFSERYFGRVNFLHCFHQQLACFFWCGCLKQNESLVSQRIALCIMRVGREINTAARFPLCIEEVFPASYLDVKSSPVQKIVQRILARLHDSLANVDRELLKHQVEMVALCRLCLAKIFQSLPSKKASVSWTSRSHAAHREFGEGAWGVGKHDIRQK